MLHGDKFDGVVYYAPWLAKLGDTAYEWSMALNPASTASGASSACPTGRFSAYLKYKVKKAVEFISHFEDGGGARGAPARRDKA